MSKYVVSSLEDTLRPTAGDDGSIVLCEKHLAKFRRTFPEEGDNRTYDVRLFPGGEAFECENCVDGEGPRSNEHRWSISRKERAADLFRLTVGDELRRLAGIVDRLTSVLLAALLVLAYPQLKTAIIPYTGESWMLDSAIIVGALITSKYVRLWILRGKP